MNPLWSYISDFAAKITAGIFKAMGTDQATIDAFNKSVTIIDNSQGTLTPPQISEVVSDDLTKIKNFFNWFKWIFLGILALIVLRIIDDIFKR